MKDMLGTEVVVGDSVIYFDREMGDGDGALTGGVIKDIKHSATLVEGVDEEGAWLLSDEFAYYTTIKDLNLD